MWDINAYQINYIVTTSVSLITLTTIVEKSECKMVLNSSCEIVSQIHKTKLFRFDLLCFCVCMQKIHLLWGESDQIFDFELAKNMKT